MRSVTDLKSLRNNLWPEHNKFTKNDWVEEEIFNFSDFDNLFFVSSYNGLVYDNQGGLISVLTRIDDITCANSYDIETKKEECKSILFNLKSNFDIRNEEVVVIPYYNQDEDKEHHFTIEFSILLSQEDYLKVYEGQSYSSFDMKRNLGVLLGLI